MAVTKTNALQDAADQGRLYLAEMQTKLTEYTTYNHWRTAVGVAATKCKGSFCLLQAMVTAMEAYKYPICAVSDVVLDTLQTSCSIWENQAIVPGAPQNIWIPLEAIQAPAHHIAIRWVIFSLAEGTLNTYGPDTDSWYAPVILHQPGHFSYQECYQMLRRGKNESRMHEVKLVVPVVNRKDYLAQLQAGKSAFTSNGPLDSNKMKAFFANLTGGKLEHHLNDISDQFLVLTNVVSTWLTTQNIVSTVSLISSIATTVMSGYGYFFGEEGNKSILLSNLITGTISLACEICNLVGVTSNINSLMKMLPLITRLKGLAAKLGIMQHSSATAVGGLVNYCIAGLAIAFEFVKIPSLGNVSRGIANSKNVYQTVIGLLELCGADWFTNDGFKKTLTDMTVAARSEFINLPTQSISIPKYEQMRKWDKEASRLVKILGNDRLPAEFVSVRAAIADKLSHFTNVLYTQTRRPPPAGALFHGEPAIGKSSYVQHRFFKNIGARLGIEETSRTPYSLNSEGDYYAPYSNQPFAVYDEFGARVDSGKGATKLPNLLQIMSTGHAAMPTAEVESKNQVAMFAGVIAISNNGHEKIQHGSLTPEAKEAVKSRLPGWRVVLASGEKMTRRHDTAGRKADFTHLRFIPDATLTANGQVWEAKKPYTPDEVETWFVEQLRDIVNNFTTLDTFVPTTTEEQDASDLRGAFGYTETTKQHAGVRHDIYHMMGPSKKGKTTVLKKVMSSNPYVLNNQGKPWKWVKSLDERYDTAQFIVVDDLIDYNSYVGQTRWLQFYNALPLGTFIIISSNMSRPSWYMKWWRDRTCVPGFWTRIGTDQEIVDLWPLNAVTPTPPEVILATYGRPRTLVQTLVAECAPMLSAEEAAQTICIDADVASDPAALIAISMRHGGKAFKVCNALKDLAAAQKSTLTWDELMERIHQTIYDVDNHAKVLFRMGPHYVYVNGHLMKYKFPQTTSDIKAVHSPNGDCEVICTIANIQLGGNSKSYVVTEKDFLRLFEQGTPTFDTTYEVLVYELLTVQRMLDTEVWKALLVKWPRPTESLWKKIWNWLSARMLEAYEYLKQTSKWTIVGVLIAMCAGIYYLNKTSKEPPYPEHIVHIFEHVMEGRVAPQVFLNEIEQHKGKGRGRGKNKRGRGRGSRKISKDDYEAINSCKRSGAKYTRTDIARRLGEQNFDDLPESVQAFLHQSGLLHDINQHVLPVEHTSNSAFLSFARRVAENCGEITGAGLGVGLLIDTKYVLTAAHVVAKAGAKYRFLRHGHAPVFLKRLKVDVGHDIALMECAVSQSARNLTKHLMTFDALFQAGVTRASVLQTGPLSGMTLESGPVIIQPYHASLDDLFAWREHVGEVKTQDFTFKLGQSHSGTPWIGEVLGQPAILGIHAAGSASTSYFSFFRDDLLPVDQHSASSYAEIPHHGVGVMIPAVLHDHIDPEGEPHYVPGGNMHNYGRLDKSVYSDTTSRFEPRLEPLLDIPNTVAPAIPWRSADLLPHFDKIPADANGRKIPIHTRLVKATTHVQGPSLVSLARQMAELHWEALGKPNCYPLMDNELLFKRGNINSIELGTSAGPTMHLVENTVQSKSQCVTLDYENRRWEFKPTAAGTALKHLYYEAQELLKAGTLVAPVSKGTRKDELLPVAKAWRSRVFQAMDITHYMLGRKLLAPLQSLLHDRVDVVPLCVGVDFEAKGPALYHKLAVKGQFGASLDVSAFDASMTAAHWDALKEYVLTFYEKAGNCPKTLKFVSTFLESFKYQVMLYDTDVVLIHGTMPSGMPGTNLLDGVLSSLLFYAAAMESTNWTFKQVHEHTSLLVNGDDACFSATPELQTVLNIDQLVESYKKQNMEVTVGLKDGSRLGWQKIEDLTFVSMHFIEPVPEFHNKRFMRLKKDSLAKMAFWRRRGDHKVDMEQHMALLNCTLLYGREMYEHVRAKCVTLRRPLDPEIPEFDAASIELFHRFRPRKQGNNENESRQLTSEINRLTATTTAIQRTRNAFANLNAPKNKRDPALSPEPMNTNQKKNFNDASRKLHLDSDWDAFLSVLAVQKLASACHIVRAGESTPPASGYEWQHRILCREQTCQKRFDEELMQRPCSFGRNELELVLQVKELVRAFTVLNKAQQRTHAPLVLKALTLTRLSAHDQRAAIGCLTAFTSILKENPDYVMPHHPRWVDPETGASNNPGLSNMRERIMELNSIWNDFEAIVQQQRPPVSSSTSLAESQIPSSSARPVLSMEEIVDQLRNHHIVVGKDELLVHQVKVPRDEKINQHVGAEAQGPSTDPANMQPTSVAPATTGAEILNSAEAVHSLSYQAIGGMTVDGLVKGNYVLDAKDLMYRSMRVYTGAFAVKTVAGTKLKTLEVNPWSPDFLAPQQLSWANLHGRFSGKYFVTIQLNGSNMLYGQVAAVFIPGPGNYPDLENLTISELMQYQYVTVPITGPQTVTMEVAMPTDRLFFATKGGTETFGYIILMTFTDCGNSYDTDPFLPVTVDVQLTPDSYYTYPLQEAAPAGREMRLAELEYDSGVSSESAQAFRAKHQELEVPELLLGDVKDWYIPDFPILTGLLVGDGTRFRRFITSRGDEGSSACFENDTAIKPSGRLSSKSTSLGLFLYQGNNVSYTGYPCAVMGPAFEAVLGSAIYTGAARFPHIRGPKGDNPNYALGTVCRPEYNPQAAVLTYTVTRDIDGSPNQWLKTASLSGCAEAPSESGPLTGPIVAPLGTTNFPLGGTTISPEDEPACIQVFPAGRTPDNPYGYESVNMILPLAEGGTQGFAAWEIPITIADEWYGCNQPATEPTGTAANIDMTPPTVLYTTSEQDYAPYGYTALAVAPLNSYIPGIVRTTNSGETMATGDALRRLAIEVAERSEGSKFKSVVYSLINVNGQFIMDVLVNRHGVWANSETANYWALPGWNAGTYRWRATRSVADWPAIRSINPKIRLLSRVVPEGKNDGMVVGSEKQLLKPICLREKREVETSFFGVLQHGLAAAGATIGSGLLGGLFGTIGNAQNNAYTKQQMELAFKHNSELANQSFLQSRKLQQKQAEYNQQQTKLESAQNLRAQNTKMGSIGLNLLG